MTPVRLNQIRRLYEEALEQDPGSRSAFIGRACGSDSELRDEIYSMLAAGSELDGFLDEPAFLRPPYSLPAFDSSASVLTPGEIIAKRYTILRLEGIGGMGEVYRAEDRTLNRTVALKVLRSERLGDANRRRSLVEEARAASALNHPHIATIYDFGTSDGLEFITMEYVTGQMLDEIVAGQALPLEEALKYAIEIADALVAARAAGIVHRDLKPGNVIITAENSVKVLDFGLAKLAATSDRIKAEAAEAVPGETPHQAIGLTKHTLPGAIVGTAAYMSPEQAAGSPVDHRSDIFSFGALVYEMVTGRRAFQGDTAMSTVTQILRHDPQPIGELAPQLPLKLQRVVARCLQKDLNRRFQSIGEVKTLLESVQPVAARRAETRRYGVAAAAGMLLIAAALVSLPVSRLGPFEIAAPNGTKARASADAVRNGGPALQTRRSVAVLGFRNLSGGPASAWLSTALAEMFSSELGAGEQLRIVPGENVDRMKVELALAEAESYAPSTLARIRANLNADIIVLGSFLHLGKEGGSRIRVDIRLQDSGSGRTIASMVETGDEAGLFDLVLRCGDGLRRRLGVATATESETRSFRASFPANHRALQLYSEAVRKARRFESMAARDLLYAAIKEDPNNPVTRSMLATVLVLLGADKLGTDEARKAFEQSAGLPREQQLLIEGRYRAMNRERDKAIAIFRALFSFFPDNVDYGVILARNQYQAGKGTEALATIEELQKLPAPWSQDPQIPLTEAFAAMALSDFPRELSASTRAVRAAAAVDAKLVVARARIPEAWALRNLGRPAEARKSLEEAHRIYLEAGDRNGAAQTLIPLAIILYDDRDLAGAAKLYEEALALYRETGDRYSTFIALSNLATIEMDLWHLDAARRSFQEGLEISVEVGRKQAIGAAHSGLAEVIRYQGHLKESFEHYTEALNISREAGDKSRTAEALFGQAQVFRLKGDLNRARLLHADALKLRQETRQPAHEAASRLAIARIAMDARQFAEAESEARLARELFTKIKRATRAAEADILIAESLIERRRNGEAVAMLSPIEQALEARGDNEQLLRLDLFRAKVRAATGQPAEALKLVESTAARTATGPMELHYDVRLHWGSIERQHGSEPAGRKILGALSADARSKGFKLFTDKATRALQGPRP